MCIRDRVILAAEVQDQNLIHRKSIILTEDKAVLIGLVNDGQGLDGHPRLAQLVAAVLEALFNGDGNTLELRTGFLDDVAQACLLYTSRCV